MFYIIHVNAHFSITYTYPFIFASFSTFLTSQKRRKYRRFPKITGFALSYVNNFLQFNYKKQKE